MHLGHRVRKLIQTVTEERDLGVHVTSDLKPSLHCGRAVAKASSTLGLIRRHFKHIDKESFLILYKAYTRPHLEYCVQSWSPSLVKDITCLEQIQRRATNEEFEEVVAVGSGAIGLCVSSGECEDVAGGMRYGGCTGASEAEVVK